MMNKNRFYDISIILLAFLFCVSFPWNLFFPKLALAIVLGQIFIGIAFSIFLFIYLKKANSLEIRKDQPNKKNILLLLPLIAVSFSNYIYVLFDKNSEFLPNFSIITILNFILLFVIVLNEEMVFRAVILGNLNIANRLLKIVVSALIFGLFHITRFFSSFNPSDLIIIIYTFGFGIILGFLYEYGNSLIMSMVFHFAFNLFNDILFTSLFSINNYPLFILVSIGVSCFSAIYLIILYFCVFKKNELVKEESR